MAPRARKSERRTEALTRERIVEAAVELLDASGEGGLTFRALTGRLATGPGAIYWHVANKGELLDAATDAVVVAALAPEPVGAAGSAGSARSAGSVGAARSAGAAGSSGSPQEGIRAVALGLYEAIDAHPWLAAQLAAQLSRTPWRSVTPRIFESIGQRVRALGVPEDGQFAAASALMHYILGAAGQNAVNGASARALGSDGEREALLDASSKAWKELDPEAYPFTRAVADQMREHDDREQFLAGVTLILAGITAVHPPAG